MPKGNAPFTPRHTEVVARETINGLFLECLSLMRSKEPAAWESIGFKLDEAADVARVAEGALALRVRDEEKNATKAAAAPTAIPCAGFPEVTFPRVTFPRVTFLPDPSSAHGAALAAIISGLTRGRR